MALDSLSNQLPTADDLPALARNLHDLLPKIQNVDHGLARGIDVIGRELAGGKDPADVKVRTQVAFLVQDAERHLGKGAVPMAPELREEMTERAATVPGLQDERMKRLLGATDGMDDRRLVRDIRRTAMTMGSGDGSSATAAAADKHVEELERRAGITAGPGGLAKSDEAIAVSASNDAAPPRPNFGQPRVEPARAASSPIEASVPPAATTAGAGGVDGTQAARPLTPRGQGPVSDEPPPHPGPVEVQPAGKAAPVNEAPAKPDHVIPPVEGTATGRAVHPDLAPPAARDVPRAGSPSERAEPAARRPAAEGGAQGNAQGAVNREPQPEAPGSVRERVQPVPSPGDPSRSTSSPPPAQEAFGRPPAGPTAMSGAASAQARSGRVTMLRKLAESARPPSEALPAQHYVPFGGRVSAQKATGEDRRADRLLTQAETAGRKAAEAVETFSAGLGRSFMSKVEAAAEKEPGGVPAVLQEMRQGGKHASLRQELDKNLKTDAAFASSYSNTANALGEYGKARVAVADHLKSKGLSSQLADERLQRTDAALGEGAARIPGRAEGKSMLEELAEKASAMLQKAVDKVTSMFRKPEEQIAPQQSRPTPSMSMS